MSTAKKRVPRKSAKNAELIYGLGITGLSVARYLKRNDTNAIYCDGKTEPPGLGQLRELDANASVLSPEGAGKLLKTVKRVIVSPGIPDSDVLLTEARKKGLTIATDVELFVDQAKAPIVAVTGSNGKSTVATLLALMCAAAGQKAYAGANLGTPVLDLLDADKPDFYVLELSSFQLHRVPNLPLKVAGLLNISPDHLDWHVDAEEYAAAKYRIFREAQSVVFNRADKKAQQHIPKGVPSLNFGLDEPTDGQFGIREDNGVRFLARGEQLLLSTDDVALTGIHNHANALAALAIGQFMGLGMPAMLQVLNEFPGLPHRMQFVTRFNGVDFINDSKATNVGAAIASIESINGFVVLIAGGLGKGGDFDDFARRIHSRLRCAVLIGKDAPLIANALEGLAPVHLADDMQKAVRVAAEMAEADDTVLLAPACASLDQYENYQRRGDDFCRAVQVLRS